MSLKDEKWPFVIGFLLSLASWHIAQLTDEIRSAATVLYSVEIDRSKRTYFVSIENISKEKSVSGVTFLIQCRGGAACIDSASPETRKVDVPPTYSSGNPIADDNSMRIKLHIAAGGKFGMRAKLYDAAERPEFFLMLTSESPSDVYILDSNSLRGWFVGNYLLLVTVSFVVTLLVFLLLLAGLTGVWRSRRSNQLVGDPLQTGRPVAQADPETVGRAK